MTREIHTCHSCIRDPVMTLCFVQSSNEGGVEQVKVSITQIQRWMRYLLIEGAGVGESVLVRWDQAQ